MTNFFHSPIRALLWLLLPGGVLFTSCKHEADPEPKPVSAFTATAGTCQSICPVTFQNTSQNATSYLWNFGDGTTSTQADASFSHSFATTGTFTVTLTAKGNGGIDVSTKQVTVGSGGGGCANPATVQVTSNITQTTTWESCKVYVVNGAIGVSSTLTIQPGAIVKFKSASGSLSLSTGGRITAVGTATEPIIFTSYLDDAHGGDTNGDGAATAPTKKNWNEISQNGQAGSTFEYCQFYYGGNNTHASTLYLSTGAATVRNCTFAHNAGASAYNAGALEASSAPAGTVIQNNTFFKNELPLSISNYFDLDNSNVFHNPANAAEGNDYNGIWVIDGSSNSPSLTWAETEIPFVLGTAGFQSPLTLGPGVMLKFMADGSLGLGGNGRLLARGTASQPVTFTSYLDDAVGGDTNHDGTATTPNKRDWRSVGLNATNGSALDYCRMYYGGKGGSTLDMFGAVASVTNCTFAHLGDDVSVITRAAVDAYSVAAGTVIQNNTFFDTVRPLSITSSIDLDDSNVFHNPANASEKNQYQGIIVNWNNNVSKANVVWRESELAYVAITDVDVARGKTLQLGNNVVIKFMTGREIVLRDDESQLINYNGTGVRYTSVKDDSVGGDSNGNGAANAPVVGDWAGIYVDRLTNTWMRWPNMSYSSH